MTKELTKRKSWSFSLRSLMIATAVAALLVFVFVAEYEFISVVDSASSKSPDGKRTIVVEVKKHKSLYRRFNTVEAKLHNGDNENPGRIQHHFLGQPETESSTPPDYGALGESGICWSEDSKSVTYHISEIESATLFLGKESRKTEVRRHDSSDRE